VLEASPDNLKALFRRGQALVHLKDWDKAEVWKIILLQTEDRRHMPFSKGFYVNKMVHLCNFIKDFF